MAANLSHTGDLMVALILQIPDLGPLGSQASCTILTILAKASTDKILLFSSDGGIVFQEEWWPNKSSNSKNVHLWTFFLPNGETVG